MFSEDAAIDGDNFRCVGDGYFQQADGPGSSETLPGCWPSAGAGKRHDHSCQKLQSASTVFVRLFGWCFGSGDVRGPRPGRFNTSESNGAAASEGHVY